MEDRMRAIEGDIKDIKDNHLNDIYQRLVKVETKQWFVIALTLMVFGAVIGQYFA